MLLFAARMILVALLVFLLFKPVKFSKEQVVERPKLLWMQDYSASMKYSADSAELIAFLQNKEEVKNRLEKKYDVVFLPFSEGVIESDSLSFTGTLTDYTKSIKDARNRWGAEHVGAVLWVTDGILNEGANPQYLLEEWGIPQYVLAVGDSSLKPDLYIADIRSNRLVYLDNSFEVEIDISSQKISPGSTALSIWRNGKQVATEQIKYNAQGVTTVKFQIQAKEPGQIRYQAELQPVKGESRLENNSASFKIEVLDNKKKILIQAAGPHPDLSFIAEILTSETGNEITWNFGEWATKLDGFDLLIAHNMPLKDLHEFRGNIFWMAPSLSKSARLSGVHKAFEYVDPVAGNDELFGNVKNSFSNFNVDDRWSGMIDIAPPLTGPYWTSAWPEWNTLVTAKIGRIQTNSPIFTVREFENKHLGFFAGEGIWKWKMDEVYRTEGYQVNSAVWQSAMHFLLVNTARERLTAEWPNRINKGRSFGLSATFYDAAYQIITDGDVEVSFKSDSQEYVRQLSFVNGRYRTNMPSLEDGIYQYELRASKGTEKLSRKGSFEVISQDIEKMDNRMRYRELALWSSQSAGEIALIPKHEQLIQKLLDNENISNIYTYQRNNTSLMDSLLVFILIVFLGSFEWFTRKYNGSL